MQHVVDGQRFPQLNAMLAAGTFATEGADQADDRDFQWGLDAILDGVAARIAATPPTPG